MPVIPQQWSTIQSPPVLLRADLSACFGTHTEVLIVRVCGPVESMQYIFPMHFQKNESKSSSNPQLLREVTTGSLRWSPCVRFESPSVHLKRAGRVETSIADCTSCTDIKQPQDFFSLFLKIKDTFFFFFFRKTVKFLSSPSQKTFLCFDVGVCLVHSWAAYIHCCCCFNGVLRFLSPPLYSIGTVLDNVKDTKEQQIKKTTLLSILTVIQTKEKNSIEVKSIRMKLPLKNLISKN